MKNRHVLYRVYNSNDELLYVGASSNFAQRIQQHERAEAPWWDDAARITLERADDWEELMKMEEAVILVERPLHNVLHGRPRYGPAKPRRPKGEGSLFQRPVDGLWVGAVDLPPGIDGKRRRKYVSSKSRTEALRKFEYLKAVVAQDKERLKDLERCQFVQPDLGRCVYNNGHRLTYHLCGGQKVDP